MKTNLVQYRVKPDRVEENRAAVKAVFAELAQRPPPGLRYATFTLEDGCSFVHLAQSEGADGSNPLGEVAAFRAFLAGVKDRCVEPPVVRAMQAVSSYRFGEDEQ